MNKYYLKNKIENLKIKLINENGRLLNLLKTNPTSEVMIWNSVYKISDDLVKLIKYSGVSTNE